MIQALKDRLGMTEAVEEAKELLAEEYDNYPEGIEKIRLERKSGRNRFVNVHLKEPFDRSVMQEVADDMDLDLRVETLHEHEGESWFGFYREEEEGHLIEGNVPIDGPYAIHPGPMDSIEKFPFEVLVRYLTKRYGDESTFDK